ncbi:predicted protein [Chaetoceros tenuissimus]|uniref:Uncharacterized protein n=1 Tax=Chaetoceros tenuissimus TaxID=426638 RepID=A0AAD3CGS0_9STRA|nr:predicted protein [Chaetoceros tenuissimus]
MIESRIDEWVDFSTNAEFQPFVEQKQVKTLEVKQNPKRDELIVPKLSLPLNHYCMIAEKVFISFLKSFRGLYNPSCETSTQETVSTLGKRLLLFVNIVIPTHDDFYRENYSKEKNRIHSIAHQVQDYLDKLYDISSEERDDVEHVEHVVDVDSTPTTVTTFNQVLSPTEFSQYCMPCNDSPSIITVDESFESFDKVHSSHEEFEVVHSSNAFDNDFSIDRNEIELVDIGVCGSWETCSFDSTHVHFGNKDQDEDDFPFGVLPDVDSTLSVSSKDDVSSCNESTTSTSTSTSKSSNGKQVSAYKSELTREIECKASNFSALMNHWKAKEREWKDRHVK